MTKSNLLSVAAAALAAAVIAYASKLAADEIRRNDGIAVSDDDIAKESVRVGVG